MKMGDSLVLRREESQPDAACGGRIREAGVGVVAKLPSEVRHQRGRTVTRPIQWGAESWSPAVEVQLVVGGVKFVLVSTSDVMLGTSYLVVVSGNLKYLALQHDRRICDGELRN
jgi:hypothetical protein